MSTLHDYGTIMSIDLSGYNGEKVTTFNPDGTINTTSDTRVLDKEMKIALLRLNGQMDDMSADHNINCQVNLKAFSLLPVAEETALSLRLSQNLTNYTVTRDNILNCADLSQFDIIDKGMPGYGS